MTPQATQDLLQILVAVEENAWQALASGDGADFYEEHLTADALMVFPFGVLDRAAVVASLRDVPTWATYRIEEPQVVPLSERSAALTYLATAQRAGEEPYTARMTTIFVRQDGAWKTAFHQQTPVTSS